MADRIIKGDSGNDVVIQNNAGSRKIEVTNSGDVEVTGDVKTTTVKATNLKANDGTAGIVVADSTGEVTSSGGLKGVNVKTTNLKANDGTAGLVIADSTGRITFSENNPVITLGSNASFPPGHVIQTVVNSTTTSAAITGTSAGSGTSTGLTVTITAKSTSNKFLIQYVGSLIMDTANGPAVSIEIHDGSSVVASDPPYGWTLNSDGNEVDNQYKYPFMAFITPSSSSALTYTVRAYKKDLPQAVTFQNDTKASIICIQEIQQ